MSRSTLTVRQIMTAKRMARQKCDVTPKARWYRLKKYVNLKLSPKEKDHQREVARIIRDWSSTVRADAIEDGVSNLDRRELMERITAYYRSQR